MKLYWHPISGYALQAHMLLSKLDLEFKLITIDLKAGEQQTPDFLALNPFGQIPVLVDGTSSFLIQTRSWYILLPLMTKNKDGFLTRPYCGHTSNNFFPSPPIG